MSSDHTERLEPEPGGVPQGMPPLTVPIGPAAQTIGGDSAAGATPPAAVPGYEILEEVGRGGMGVVYKARDRRLQRLVALKLILAGSHAAGAERERFRTEVEAVARLQHPNIVQIYEIGEHEGRPYCALEFVGGGSLDRLLSGNPLPAREAAQLIEIVARAMHYAHQCGVVHRDLKPANILLQQLATDEHGLTQIKKRENTDPDSSIRVDPCSSVANSAPKIADFGLAKRLDSDSGLTASGSILGTPSYMAPEQARGEASAVGPAADVYALGAILYELLTGRPPFKAATPLETVMQVARDEPVPPRRLQPSIPLDLDTICLKCLQKESRRRYESAAALADDLRRFLDRAPIRARPVGALERAAKWARRRPAVAALLALVAVLTVVGFALVLWQWQLAEDARAEADRRAAAEKEARELAAAQEQEARRQLLRAETARYAIQISLARREWQDGNVSRARALLDECVPALRGWEHAYLSRLFAGSRLTLDAHTNEVLAVALSADGKRLASAGGDRIIIIWDAQSGKELRRLEGHGHFVTGLAFDGAGRRLVSTSVDRTARVWDVQTGKELARFTGHTEPPMRAAFSADGTRIATAGKDHTVRVWGADDGKELLELFGHGEPVTCVAFSADGKLLASGSWDRTVRLWDAESGKPLRTLRGHGDRVTGVAFSPDGKRLASASQDQTVRLWDPAAGGEAKVLKGHTDEVSGVAFSPDGRALFSSSWDRTVLVWSADGERLGALKGHAARVNAVAVARQGNGNILATASGDKTVKLWDGEPAQDAKLLAGHDDGVTALAFAHGGDLLASASWDRTMRLWDPRAASAVGTLAGHWGTVSGLAFSCDGKKLITASWDKSARIWDVKSRKQLVVLEGHTETVAAAAFSPDGATVATGSWDKTLRLWDGTTGKAIRTLGSHAAEVRAVAFAPDGAHIVSAAGDGVVRVWNAANGELRKSLTGHKSHVNALAFSADGTLLASAGLDGKVRLWDWPTGTLKLVLEGHTQEILGVGFSPDGRRLATASSDGSVKLWDLRTGQETLTLAAHTRAATGVAFAPDGRTLATCGLDGAVKLWRAD